MSKFTNAIKGMSKLKKAMVGMWLAVAATLIALVAVLISFGDKSTGKDRIADAKTHVATSPQYTVTNPETKFDAADKQIHIEKLNIKELAFDQPTDASYSSQADALTRFLFDVKARSKQYKAMYNTKTKVGTFFLLNTLAYLDTQSTNSNWVDGDAVKNDKTNEVKVVKKGGAEGDFKTLPTATTDEIFTSDLDAKLVNGKGLISAPSATKLTYKVSRVDSTITRTTINGSDKVDDTFKIVYNDKAFTFNSEANAKSNTTAGIGMVFALTLVGAIGVTVAESIYRKRGAK